MAAASDDIEEQDGDVVFDLDNADGLVEVDRGLTEQALVVQLDGYEGPLDVLLTLARAQKVDLKQISILKLVDQYVAFIEKATKVRLELAADYLVMAAWLAFLKSRLIIPKEDEEEGPSGEEMAAILAFRLQRLQAMRKAAGQLFGRDRLGRDFFFRGAPEGIRVTRKTHWQATLYDLLKAYGDERSRGALATLSVERPSVRSMEEALKRLKALVGQLPKWTTLVDFMPMDWRGDSKTFRSAVASTFAASLEMVREGKLEIQQEGTFGQIYVRSAGEEDKTND